MPYLSAASFYGYLISPATYLLSFIRPHQLPNRAMCERALAQHPELLSRIKAYLKHITRAFIDPFLFSDEMLHEFIETNATYFLVDVTSAPNQFPNALMRYNTSLQKKLDELLKIKYRKIYQIEKPQKNIIEQSMSYIWINSKNKASEATSFLNKLADAHGLIQITGWSTQNENSLFALFDLYNYFRFYDSIAAYRDILVGILTPLLPIYYEYRSVSRSEQNVFFKITRMLIPLLITAGILVGVGILLSPFAIPEFAFIVLAIPILYVGLALAAQYICLKSEVYYGIRRLWYGGIYETPEFQENNRLKAAFPLHSTHVQSYYINSLKACDKLEETLQNSEPLSERDLKKRADNRALRQTLLLEWFDIHSNQNIGYDEARVIFKNRLDSDAQHLSETLDESLTDAEQQIRKHITAFNTYCQAHPLEIDVPDTPLPSLIQKLCFFPSEEPINRKLENIQTTQEEVYNPAHLIYL